MSPPTDSAKSVLVEALSWRHMSKILVLLVVLVLAATLAILAITSTITSAQEDDQGAGGSPLNGSLTLNWNTPGDGSVTGYYYSTDHGVNWYPIPSDSSATDITGPAAGEAIVVLIQAGGPTSSVTIGPGQARGLSPSAQATPQPTPTSVVAKKQLSPIPAVTASTGSPGTVVLSWTEAAPPIQPTPIPGAAYSQSGPAPTVIRYEIDWSPDGSDGSWQLLATREPHQGLYYEDTTLSEGETRYYRTRAQYSTGGFSDWSATTRAVAGINRPYTPVLTAETPSSRSIKLTWTKEAGAREGSEVYAYEFEHSDTGLEGSWEGIGSQRATYQEEYWDSPEPGVVRYYRMRSVGYGGTHSLYSNVVNAVALPNKPGRPQTEAYAAGTNAVYISWSPWDGGDSPITSQNIQVSTDGGENYSTLNAGLTATSTTYHHTGLPAGAERHYRVQSCNAGGCGDWGEASATAGDNPVPAPPAITVTATGPKQTVVTWTQPDDGGSAITQYHLECNSDPSGWGVVSYCGGRLDKEQRSYTDEIDLLGGTKRHYRMSASNANGDGPWGPWVVVTTPRGVPEEVYWPDITAENDDSISLSWTEPHGGPMTGYVVERSEPGIDSELWTRVATLGGTVTTFTDSGLYSGTEYYYRVAAVNEVGQGIWSQDVYAGTTGEEQYAPGPVNDFRIKSIGAGRVTLAWDPPEHDGGRPVTGYGYRMYDWCSAEEKLETLPATAREVSFTGITCDETKVMAFFDVWPLNEIGRGSEEGVWLTMPNKGGTMVVSASELTISEGGTASYTIKTSKQPTYDLTLWVGAFGDSALEDQFHWTDTYLITPENWQQGITVTVDAPEDLNTENETGVLWHGVTTEVHVGSEDPEFHEISSQSVKVTFRDTGANGGAGS